MSKLKNTQEVNKTLEGFHAALTAKAARSELRFLEDEIVRGLFVSKMKNTTLENRLTFEAISAEELVKMSLKKLKTVRNDKVGISKQK